MLYSVVRWLNVFVAFPFLFVFGVVLHTLFLTTLEVLKTRACLSRFYIYSVFEA